MIKSAFNLYFVAALALSSAAFAQETTTEGDGETPSTLSMGVEEGPQLGQPYPAAEHGDWIKRCVKSDLEQDPCQLYQLLTDENNSPIVEVSLFKLANAGQAVAGAAIVVPLETLLTQNLTLAVDDERGKVYPYTFCTIQGCVARVGFSANDIAAFKSGAMGKITIVPAGTADQKITVDMSLTGFTAGFDDLVPNDQ